MFRVFMFFEIDILLLFKIINMLGFILFMWFIVLNVILVVIVLLLIIVIVLWFLFFFLVVIVMLSVVEIEVFEWLILKVL